MEIYVKTSLELDALADKVRDALNLPECNRTPLRAEQKRYGLNIGGGYYYSFDLAGLELNLIRNAGEAAIPERAAYSHCCMPRAI